MSQKLSDHLSGQTIVGEKVIFKKDHLSAMDFNTPEIRKKMAEVKKANLEIEESAKMDMKKFRDTYFNI